RGTHDAADNPPHAASRRPARSACPCWARQLATSATLLRRRGTGGELRGTRNRVVGGALQMLVNLLQRDAATDHDHLGPVDQLRNLQCGTVMCPVLGGDPDLTGLLEQLLALRMHTCIECVDSAGAGR